MKLSISNIAWDRKDDTEIYQFLQENQFSGLEIAPTRLIENKPYEQNNKAVLLCNEIYKKYQLSISSMQSIWYGRTENVFHSITEREYLKKYTYQAINFAEAIRCPNIVFGCPKNRNMDSNAHFKSIIPFFNNIANYALSHNTIIALEPNPTIYGTNFINTTQEAFNFIKEISNPGLKVNLDFGTILENNENLACIEQNIDCINHIHISEPNLESIKSRELHTELAHILRTCNYSKYISIEMKNQKDLSLIKDIISYVKEVFS